MDARKYLEDPTYRVAVRRANDRALALCAVAVVAVALFAIVSDGPGAFWGRIALGLSALAYLLVAPVTQQSVGEMLKSDFRSMKRGFAALRPRRSSDR